MKNDALIQINAGLWVASKLMGTTLSNGLMVIAAAYRNLSTLAQQYRLLAIACAVMLGLFATPANAHAPILVRGSTVSHHCVSVVEQGSLAMELEASDPSSHSCPSDKAHMAHQSCAGGGSCHAVATGAAAAMDAYSHHMSYEPNDNEVDDGHEVSPLFHPPKI